MDNVIGFGGSVSDGLDLFLNKGEANDEPTSRRMVTASSNLEKEAPPKVSFGKESVFPASKFIRMGADVKQGSQSGQFVIDFGNKHYSAVNEKFISQILDEASVSNDLINLAAPLWKINKIGSNKFSIERIAA